MTDALLSQLTAARTGGARVAAPEGLPDTMEAAYAVASRLGDAIGRGAPVGWKVGATSAGAQAALGVPGPIRGRVFADGVAKAPATLAADEGLEAEPEIIVRLADTLEEGVVPRDADEATGFVGQVFVGLEVNRPSYTDPFAVGARGIVADNAAHHGLVVGPRLGWGTPGNLADVTVALSLNGEPVSEGRGGDVLGNPLESIVWLANALADHPDGPLRPGDWIATGAMARSAKLSAGDTLTAAFAPGGDVVLRIEDHA